MIEAITLGLWSHHFHNNYNNEVHDLVGLQIGHAYVAHYNNSHNRDTTLAVYVTGQRCYGYLCADIMAGVATGYREQTGHRLTPFILPRLKLQLTENSYLYTIVIPTEVAAAGFEFRF